MIVKYLMIGWIAVMEGKAILFKHFGDVDAVPIILSTQDPDEIIRIVEGIAPTFGGINLEDISAPNCFYIEEELKKRLNIPVFHDDQHGTAIVVLAGLINALKLTQRDIATTKIVLSGAGAAGIAIIKLLALYGAQHVIALDSRGVIVTDRDWLNTYKQSIASLNKNNQTGWLSDVIVGADVFIGVSGQKDDLTAEDIRQMNPQAIVFALSNPDPEVNPDLAKQAGAYIIATGRSDYPNQLNNVIVFPGIFRGILDAGIPQILDTHKIAAAEALAAYVSSPNTDHIIPDALDMNVAGIVAEAVRTVW
jgi:malate dehydrogenase (oxaloacetate-decarboxylating)